jgi:DNA-binding NtrC family response regulator
MERYAWPSNIRELQNLIELACVLSAEPGVESLEQPDPGSRPVGRPGTRSAGDRKFCGGG